MFMQAYTNQTYALLRIFTGLTFLFHGAQKLFAFPIPIPAPMAEQMPSFVVPIAGPIELIGGLLVAVGLFTRWSAFLCSGLMAAAYWMQSWIADDGSRMAGVFPARHPGRFGHRVLLCLLVHLGTRVGNLECG